MRYPSRLRALRPMEQASILFHLTSLTFHNSVGHMPVAQSALSEDGVKADDSHFVDHEVVEL